MKLIRFTCFLFFTAIVFGCGPHLGPNPLKGWKCLGTAADVGCPFEQSIRQDYQSYIQTLPDYQRFMIELNTMFFEDGAGQRAVEITLSHDGIHWKHVLIYDRNGKRKKFIKYASGRYMS